MGVTSAVSLNSFSNSCSLLYIFLAFIYFPALLFIKCFWLKQSITFPNKGREEFGSIDFRDIISLNIHTIILSPWIDVLCSLIKSSAKGIIWRIQNWSKDIGLTFKLLISSTDFLSSVESIPSGRRIPLCNARLLGGRKDLVLRARYSDLEVPPRKMGSCLKHSLNFSSG